MDSDGAAEYKCKARHLRLSFSVWGGDEAFFSFMLIPCHAGKKGASKRY